MENLSQIKKRKDEHIQFTLDNNCNSPESTWMEHIKLNHYGLPDFDIQDVFLETSLFRKDLSAPIIFGALTGGTELASKINKNLAIVAEELGLGMMVGSQRIAIEHPSVEKTFKIARDNAPTIPIISNIGVPQILTYNTEQIEKIIKMVEADALAIHLNPLQEVIQSEGQSKFSGALDRIIELRDTIDIPIVIKETGTGISKETAQQFIANGIHYIDVAGLGGTNFAIIESLRNNIVTPFDSWGIPTAASILEVNSVRRATTKIIASGGLRTGIDFLKSMVLGADYVSIAKPLLKPAIEGTKTLKNYINGLVDELKLAMYLSNLKDILSIQIQRKKQSPILIGPLHQWNEQRIQ